MNGRDTTACLSPLVSGGQEQAENTQPSSVSIPARMDIENWPILIVLTPASPPSVVPNDPKVCTLKHTLTYLHLSPAFSELLGTCECSNLLELSGSPNRSSSGEPLPAPHFLSSVAERGRRLWQVKCQPMLWAHIKRSCGFLCSFPRSKTIFFF